MAIFGMFLGFCDSKIADPSGETNLFDTISNFSSNGNDECFVSSNFAGFSAEIVWQSLLH